MYYLPIWMSMWDHGNIRVENKNHGRKIPLCVYEGEPAFWKKMYLPWNVCCASVFRGWGIWEKHDSQTDANTACKWLQCWVSCWYTHTHCQHPWCCNNEWIIPMMGLLMWENVKMWKKSYSKLSFVELLGSVKPLSLTILISLPSTAAVLNLFTRHKLVKCLNFFSRTGL